MSNYMKTLSSLRNCIYNYNKIRPIIGNNAIYKVKTFLNDYNNNNTGDWEKYMEYNIFGYCKINIDIINNIEINMVNIPKNINHYDTNVGNSTLLLLDGNIEKSYINNDFIIPKEYEAGDIFTIYDTETYSVLPLTDAIMLDITINDFDYYNYYNKMNNIAYNKE
jgi:hypothetical protein